MSSAERAGLIALHKPRNEPSRPFPKALQEERQQLLTDGRFSVVDGGAVEISEGLSLHNGFGDFPGSVHVSGLGSTHR